jgi:uncharacterized protein (DUF58 family)
MGAYIDFQSLVNLESKARAITLRPRRPIHTQVSGRHESRMRGRGLDFDELRVYLPGDDIRAVDWRVTARMGKPFVRVFTEERDRPVLVWIDQRINMFFGSRLSTKSVTAAEVGALCLWSAYAHGDRCCALISSDSQMEEGTPRRSRADILQTLGQLADKNRQLQALYAEAPGGGQLNLALRRIFQRARRDFTIVIVSDFDGRDTATEKLLLDLSAQNDVVIVLVYDPLEMRLPEKGDLVASDGHLQVELQFQRESLRSSLSNASSARIEAIAGWQQQIGVPVLQINSGEETAPQVRELFSRASDMRSEL